MRLPNIESIQKSYEHVYISPHMDDVVLSCGGRIATQLSKGESVLIVTVFTGDVNEKSRPKGRALDPLINIKRRRVEDEKAMERLGVDYIWLDYIDGIFRYRPPILRYGLHMRVMDKERKLCEALHDDIRKICMAARNKRLYLPLGVGQHVDHQILFQVGRRLKHWGKHDFELYFYEDVVYVLLPNALKYRMKLIGINIGSITSENDLTQKKSVVQGIVELYKAIVSVPTLKLDNPLLKPIVFIFLMLSIIFMVCLLKPRAGALGRWDISPEVFDISSGMKEKLEAILEYSSQLNAPFWNRETMGHSLARYSQAIGGSEGQYLERYWRIVS